MTLPARIVSPICLAAHPGAGGTRRRICAGWKGWWQASVRSAGCSTRFTDNKNHAKMDVVFSAAISLCYQLSVSRRCFHFVQAIAFDSRSPSRGFYLSFALLLFSSFIPFSSNGSLYSFTLNLSIMMSCASCSRMYFAIVLNSILLCSHNTLLTKKPISIFIL